MLKSKKNIEVHKKKVAATAKTLADTPVSLRELVETLIKKIYVSPGNQIEVDWLITSEYTGNEVL